MQRMRRRVVFLLLGVMICVLNLHAGFSFEFDIVSAFIWRGEDAYDNNPAFQPSVTYTFGDSGFSVNVWGSFPLADRAEYKEWDEVDVTFNYDFRVSENISLSVGMIDYVFYAMPGYTFKNGNSQEFYIIAGLPGIFLGPSVSVYYDINLGSGLYVELVAGHTFAFTEKVDLELGASLGYRSKLYIDESGISDLNLSASVPFSMGKVRITPSLHFTRVYLEPLYYSGVNKSKFWLGINFGID